MSDKPKDLNDSLNQTGEMALSKMQGSAGPRPAFRPAPTAQAHILTNTAVAPKPRPWWPFALLVLLALSMAVAGAAWLVLGLRPVGVRSQRIEGRLHVPRYYPGAALSVRPKQEVWLAFGGQGKLAQPLPKVGDIVKRGQVVGRLRLMPEHEKHAQAAKKAVDGARTRRSEAVRSLAQAEAQRQKAQAEVRAAEQKATPPSGDKKAGRKSHQNQAKVTSAHKHLMAAVRSLTGLTKRVETATAALTAAQNEQKKWEATLGANVILAPFDAVVADVRVPANNAVAAKANVVRLRNKGAVHALFRLDDPSGFKVGTTVQVAVSGGPPVNAILAELQRSAMEFEAMVEIPDPAGTFMKTAAEAFRLAHDYVPLAYMVPVQGIFGGFTAGANAQRAYIWRIEMGHLTLHDVTVLEAAAHTALITDPRNALPRTFDMVIRRDDGGSLAELREDTEVKARILQ